MSANFETELYCFIHHQPREEEYFPSPERRRPPVKIALYDIGHTLVLTEGENDPHADAFHYAWKEVFNIDIRKKDIPDYAGMFDMQVLWFGAKEGGVATEDIEKKIHTAKAHMIEYFLSHHTEAEYKATPGAKELIQRLAIEGSPWAGLLTGNAEVIAGVKLARAGISPLLFAFGAFGDITEYTSMDGERYSVKSRKDLLDYAYTQAHVLVFNQRTIKLLHRDIVVIADSPRDIISARAWEIPTIGVESARFSKERLIAVGADLAVSSLTEQEEILSFMRITT